MFFSKIFRNKTADILLLIGLILASILLINISGLISKISIEYESCFKYEWFGLFIMEDEENFKQLISVCENTENGNIYQETLLNIGKDSDETPALTIIKANEDLGLEYIEGEYDEVKIYKNAVIIGETLKKKTYVRDKQRYIQCNDNEFNVIGIIKNKMSGGVDNSFYVLWNTLDDDIQDKFINKGMLLESFYIKSNENDEIDNILFMMKENFDDSEVRVESLDIEDWDESNFWYKSLNKVFLGVGLLFSVITCFSVSYLWLVKRKSELAIRVAFGYSRIQIFGRLLIDLFKLLFLALVLAMAIQCIYTIYTQNTVFILEKLLLQIFIIGVGMFVIVLLNVIYMMKKLKTMDLSMRA